MPTATPAKDLSEMTDEEMAKAARRRPPCVPLIEDYGGCYRFACPTCDCPLMFVGIKTYLLVEEADRQREYYPEPAEMSFRGKCGCVRTLEVTGGSILYVREVRAHGGFPSAK